MAELPRYRRRLTRLEIPTPSFAAEKSLVNYQQQIASDLASMNKFVFESLQGVAKERAKVYGVEQAPDMEQLETIYNWNKEIDDAKAIKEEDRTDEQQSVAEREKKKLSGPGDSYSIFGTTANEYYLAQSLDTMKVFGKKKILALLQQAELDNKKYAEVKPQVEAIVEGLTDAISESDVRLGKSLNADLGLFGYTQLNSFMDTEIAAAKKKKKLLFAASKEIFFNNLDKNIMYEGGGDVLQDPKIPPEIKAKGELAAKHFRSKSYYDFVFKEFLNLAIENEVDVSNIEGMRKEFNDNIFNASLTVLNSALLTNKKPDDLYSNTQKAVAVLIKLKDKKNGNYSASTEADRKILNTLPKKVMNALITMDETQMLNALEKMRGFIIDNDKFIIDRDDQAVKLRNIEIDENQFAFGKVMSLLKADSDNKDTIVNQLTTINTRIFNLDSSPDSQYFTNLDIIEKIRAGVNFRTTKVMLDFSVKYHNDSNSDNPKLTTLDVANDFTNGKLSFDDFKTFTKTYGAIQDKDFTAALQHARTKMGIPDVTLFNGLNLKEKNYDIYNTYKNRMIEAKLNTPADKVFDPQKYNEDFLDDYVLGALTETANETYAKLTLQKREGAFAGTTKQLNRFIEDCLGKPEFQDRCESLQEFKQNIIKYHRTNEGIDKPIVGFEDLK
tara:strand:+ start:4898 stop:6904 length:2007 start_codon:yes stop_codon:yes gene_type:complete